MVCSRLDEEYRRTKMGGHLRFGEYTNNGYAIKDTFEGVYAQYFVRYLEEYRKYGIPVYAITIQNEPSNAALHGQP